MDTGPVYGAVVFFLLRNIAKKRNFFYTIYKGTNIVLNHHQTTAWC